MTNTSTRTWLSTAVAAALLATGCVAETEGTGGPADLGAPSQQEGPSGTASWAGAGPGGDLSNPASDDGLPDEFGEAVNNNPAVEDPPDDVDPQDPVLPTVDGDATLAVLSTDGGQSILILDGQGDLLETIPVVAANLQNLAWHPDGFFVAASGGQIVQVDLQGIVSPIAPINGFLYRINVSGGGDVDVAEESEVAS